MTEPVDRDTWTLHDPSRIVEHDGTLVIAVTGKEQVDGYDCGLETWVLSPGDAAWQPGLCLLRDKLFSAGGTPRVDHRWARRSRPPPGEPEGTSASLLVNKVQETRTREQGRPYRAGRPMREPPAVKNLSANSGGPGELVGLAGFLGSHCRHIPELRFYIRIYPKRLTRRVRLWINTDGFMETTQWTRWKKRS
jgi:hypothetical protein